MATSVRAATHRVVVAEDDPEMRALVVSALRKYGHEVVEVNDGGRLLVWIAREFTAVGSPCAVDLIVSDIRMPVCTGLQIVQSLRAAQWEIPVILMTAFPDLETRALALAMDALVLDKPFLMSDLRAAARSMLARTPWSGHP